MSRTSNLIRRNGRWYFNRAYPKDVWPVVGKSPFRVSLRTDALEVAQRRRPDAERRYWAAVDAARGKLAVSAPIPFSEFDAVALAGRWFHEEVRTQTANIEDALGWDFDLDEALEILDDREIEVRQALSSNDFTDIRPKAESLLLREGFAIDRRSSSYKSLLRLMLRGDRELYVLNRARMLGDYSVQPSDPAFTIAVPSALEAPSKTLGELIKAHRLDKVMSLSPSTQAAYEPVWRVMKAVLGEGRALNSIGRDQGRDLFNVVQRLPRGLGKIARLADLPLLEAVDKAEELGLPKISPKTVNASYMGFISAIFGWAVQEQWMSANPVGKLSVSDPVAEAQKRDPFTGEQLAAIFGGAPWAPRTECPRGRPLNFWGPLIALLHGLRRGEIAQLEVADIAKSAEWDVILIRPGGRKRLKTDNARRMLPIHPELVRMGFVAFVEQRRASGATQLFEGEEPDRRGQWGDGLSDWFLRLLQERGVNGRKLGMHSFRHNFQDRLREAKLHGTAIGQELAGRAKGGDTSSDYGSGFSTRSLAEATGSISYPELDLSHLYVS